MPDRRILLRLPDPHVCPQGHAVRVIDSRPAHGYIRRRVACLICHLRWTTYETIIHPRRLRSSSNRGY